MRPEQPPPPYGWLGEPPSQACTRHLEQMECATDDLVAELDLGGFAAAERIATGLLAGLRPTVAALARERASGRALIRTQLEDLADLLEATANRHGYWPLPQVNRSPLPTEVQVRALIARLRLVARN